MKEKFIISKKVEQLKIDLFAFLYRDFLEILEIFLEAVFLFIAPDFATCMRID